jgi:hypothetical protein
MSVVDVSLPEHREAVVNYFNHGLP